MSVPPLKITRRRLIQAAAATVLTAGALPGLARSAAGVDKLPPIRQVTHGPKFHWFGYYDKLQFDPTGRYLLSMEVDFEHRAPTPDDVIKVGMIDRPGNRWILCDTYPDRQRYQHVYLYDIARNRRVALGHFYQPPKYGGQWRCDTHPRFSLDGRSVVIDSPHTGQGRQLYLIDIRCVVQAAD